MADKCSMHELCSHCERAMVMNWGCFKDRPDLVDQLSSRVVQRITKGLFTALTGPRCSSIPPCPDAHKFLAWWQKEQQILR